MKPTMEFCVQARMLLAINGPRSQRQQYGMIGSMLVALNFLVCALLTLTGGRIRSKDTPLILDSVCQLDGGTMFVEELIMLFVTSPPKDCRIRAQGITTVVLRA